MLPLNDLLRNAAGSTGQTNGGPEQELREIVRRVRNLPELSILQRNRREALIIFRYVQDRPDVSDRVGVLYIKEDVYLINSRILQIFMCIGQRNTLWNCFTEIKLKKAPLKYKSSIDREIFQRLPDPSNWNVYTFTQPCRELFYSVPEILGLPFTEQEHRPEHDYFGFLADL
jgi:hypothetical protein